MMKLCITLLLSLFAFFPAVCAADSVSLSFERLSPVSSTTPVRVAVMFRSDVSINAIEGTLTLPSELPFIAVTQVSPMVSYWLTVPEYNVQTRQITFAGILLGGQTGRVDLFEILVGPIVQSATLSFDRARAYTNSPDGTEAPLSRFSLVLTPTGTLPPTDLVLYILGIAMALIVIVFSMRRMRIRWI